MTTDLATHIGAFSVDIYNNLLDVGEADRALWAREDRETFFGEVGALIHRHGLESSVGLCLLHNHNDVREDHLMVETYEEDTYATPALVMRHMARREAPSSVPVAFKVEGKKLVALEHSAVPLAKQSFAALENADSAFVEAFCDLVEGRGFANLVGLSVLRLDTIAASPDVELLERTDVDRVANVMRIDDGGGARGEGNSIETSWQFQQLAAGEVAAKCKAKCVDTGGEFDPKDHERDHVTPADD